MSESLSKKPEVLLSTGAFIGRVNGRNHRLMIEYTDKLNCDGFELMLYAPWMDEVHSILDDYKRSGINIVTLHSLKDIGDMVCDPSDEAWQRCRETFTKNCEIAAELGARKIITHIWGRPHSDKYLEAIIERCGFLMETAQNFGVDFVPENCVCFTSPLENIKKLREVYPGIGVTIDTRPAQFHRELKQICESDIFAGNMRHVHINDFHGEYMQWDALNPILQPGLGDIDFDAFFAALRGIGYDGTITLEAPSMIAEGVDTETLNRGLDFIRARI